jgi:CheY-like chemotaxis protein
VQAQSVIAVIDDEPAVVALVAEVLIDEGYETVAWPTGAGAYDLIRERMPVAVLLDMRMETPEAGMEVLRALRHDPQTQRIPVILISSRTHYEPVQAGELDALHTTRLPKPFSPTALLAAISAATSARDAAGTG